MTVFNLGQILFCPRAERTSYVIRLQVGCHAFRNAFHVTGECFFNLPDGISVFEFLEFHSYFFSCLEPLFSASSRIFQFSFHLIRQAGEMATNPAVLELKQSTKIRWSIPWLGITSLFIKWEERRGIGRPSSSRVARGPSIFLFLESATQARKLPDVYQNTENKA